MVFWRQKKEGQLLPEGETNTPQTLEFESPVSVTHDTSKWVEIIGNGSYQAWVNVLMGLISFADIAEICVTAIILPDLVCEWNLSALEKALIPGMIFTGMAIGSFIGGKLADRYGRKRMLLIGFYVIVISNIIAILSPYYLLYLVARSISGAGLGACYPIAASYLQEFSPAVHRSMGTTVFLCVGVFGSVYVCVCAILVMNLGYAWRIELTLALVPTIITLVTLHFADESPRYYVICGEEEKAMAVLRKMAHWNNVQLPIGRLKPAIPYSNSYLDVFRQPYTRTGILLSIIFFCEMYLMNGLYYFSADVFTYGYCGLSDFFTSTRSDPKGCLVYTRAWFLFFMVLCFICLPGYITSGITSEKLGRKITFVYSAWMLLVVTVLLLLCVSWVTTILEIVAAFYFSGVLIGVSWIYTPESYPTYMRATSCGIINCINRLGAAAGSFITEYMDTYNILLTICTYIIVMAVAAIATLFIQKETRGTLLVDEPETRIPQVSSYGAVNRNRNIE